MGKTVKEVADELGVSRQRVQQIISMQVASKKPQKVAGRYQLNKVDIAVISSEIKKSKSKFSDKQADNYLTSSNSKFALLQEQLREKDKQIANLQKILDQSQQLQLIAEHKIKQLEDPKATKPISKKEEKKDPVKEEPKKKKGFWSRFR